MATDRPTDGDEARPKRYIFRPWITKNGRRIYRKNGGMFRIPVED